MICEKLNILNEPFLENGKDVSRKNWGFVLNNLENDNMNWKLWKSWIWHQYPQENMKWTSYKFWFNQGKHLWILFYFQLMESLHPSTYQFPPLHQPTPWGTRVVGMQATTTCQIINITSDQKMCCDLILSFVQSVPSVRTRRTETFRRKSCHWLFLSRTL